MQLTTARLLLREFVESDREAVRHYQSDPLYTRYHPFDHPTEQDAREFVGRFLEQQQEQPRRKFQFAISDPTDGRLIGNCGLRITDHFTEAGMCEADIGHELDSRCWGRGYATEAAREMLRFGFEEPGLHRISAGCVADNVGSVRVLEKIGMRLEGRLRENKFFKGRSWDSLLYAILNREWQAHQLSPSNDVGGAV